MASPNSSFSVSDAAWMDRALALAAKADHRTSPNPMVGAVVVSRQGALVGEGHHEGPGLPHAEPQALTEAGSASRGATLYVTLEPCPVQGRTPPCVDAILASGVERVVVAMEDPDLQVRGLGISRLRDQGLRVEVGLRELEARRLNRYYIAHRTLGRPFITAKFAASLDGRVTAAGGRSGWLTGEEARRHAHLERHRHDAILIGINTVLVDDPELTARFEGARQPVRVVLDSRGRLPAQARVRRPGALLIVDRGDDLGGLLGRLAAEGIMSVLVEGGPTVLGSFFDADLVDEVLAYLAPIVVGGKDSLPAVLGRGIAELSGARRLTEVEIMRLGRDVLVRGDVQRDS